jgi:outer membrane protein TolC
MEKQSKNNQMSLKKCFLIIGFTKSVLFAFSQTYSVSDFIQQVKQHHPVAKQAAIIVDKARSDLLSSRGGFDPVLAIQNENKTFDGKNYFFYTNPEVKIPTWPGIDIKAGVENNGGSFLNSEFSSGKTSYLGVEVPLARNLLIDKRRAQLQQARLMVNMSEQERLQIINNLLFDAYLAYWNWAGANLMYKVFSRFVEVSNERLRLVRISWQLGERPAIDTAEALAQLQSFQMMQADGLVRRQNTTLEVSNFLWSETDSAYLISDYYSPDSVEVFRPEDLLMLDVLLQRGLNENPVLLSYNVKLQVLEVERKLKIQGLLPYFNLKANLLNSGYNVTKDMSVALLENNYKLGFDFKIPLRLSEGRGDYRLAKLKIQETNFQLRNKRWEVENKIKFYYNETIALQKQIILLEDALKNFTLLLRAEETRYRNGESSLFLINARENKVLETTQKLVELKLKWLKARYAAEWAAGLLR